MIGHGISVAPPTSLSGSHIKQTANFQIIDGHHFWKVRIYKFDKEHFGFFEHWANATPPRLYSNKFQEFQLAQIIRINPTSDC